MTIAQVEYNIPAQGRVHVIIYNEVNGGAEVLVWLNFPTKVDFDNFMDSLIRQWKRSSIPESYMDAFREGNAEH